MRDAGELAYEQLENRLSRSGVKETTLDYTRDFAERRGIAERMGIRSEIELASPRIDGQAFRPSAWEAQGRPRLEHPREEIVRQPAGPDVALLHGASADRPERQTPENLSLSERSVPASLGIEGLGGGRDQARDASADRLRSPVEKNKGQNLAQDLHADPRKDLAVTRGRDHGERVVNEQQRRNPFEGLKLSRGASAERPQQDRADENGPQIDQKRPQKIERQVTRKMGRSMFDGLKLNARPEPSQGQEKQPEREGSLRRRQTGLPNACGRSRRLSRPLIATHAPMNRRTGIGVRDFRSSTRSGRT